MVALMMPKFKIGLKPLTWLFQSCHGDDDEDDEGEDEGEGAAASLQVIFYSTKEKNFEEINFNMYTCTVHKTLNNDYIYNDWTDGKYL